MTTTTFTEALERGCATCAWVMGLIPWCIKQNFYICKQVGCCNIYKPIEPQAEVK